ncbi:MAG: alkaline phosphatase D family protein [Pseudobdellovibrionaceae bacterium]
MKTGRREFLKFGLLQTLNLLFQSSASAKQPTQIQRREGPSILQGATDDTKTQFNILTDDNDFEIYVANGEGKKWFPDSIQPISFPNHHKKITKVFFSNLIPREIYFLNLYDKNTKQIIDVREFQTLDLQKSSLRFAICSCMKDKEHDPDIWINMVKNKPDVLFFIGDAVYADKDAPSEGVTPAHLWNKFCEARNTLEIYYSKRLIPIFATWDDHDFGMNDGNCHQFAYVKESQTNFLSFFAQDESHCNILKRGPGVSSAVKLRNHLFILLDDRSYRDIAGSKSRYAHWGAEQELWMYNLIQQNTSPTWLMNGSQFFPSVVWKESVSRCHPVQFREFLKTLKSFTNKVIFVSGDVHYSEISRIEPEILGYETFELTSSSIHSRNIPGSPGIIPNRRRIVGTGKKNYILIDSEIRNETNSFTATCLTNNNDTKFKMKFII